MNLKEAIKNFVTKVKAVSNFNESDFVKKKDLTAYLTEEKLIKTINEVVDEMTEDLGEKNE